MSGTTANADMTVAERFRGCILGGAIGDAYGSGYENLSAERDDIFYPFGKPAQRVPDWQITDDTQLTLATIEAMLQERPVRPGTVAKQFVKHFNKRKLRGLGASTLKALRELSAGMHWTQVGRRGEYAAGNGAAMRVAPLAFRAGMTFAELRDICIITHHNDEAYVGARCVFIALREIISGNWTGDTDLLELIIPQLPDTRVRDRLIEIKDVERLSVAGDLGCDGYVVNSVPLAIAAANRISTLGMEEMFRQLIDIGGDTDTNCSIAGQIAGTLIGGRGLPKKLTAQLSGLSEYNWITTTINALVSSEGW